MMTGFERYTKKTRRVIFLEEMERVVPWAKLCALIEPHYPKLGNWRRPKELEKMLRIYFLQQWFNLADPAVEEALYDSATLRQFAGIDLGGEPVPDETTVCNFRHLLEKHNLGELSLSVDSTFVRWVAERSGERQPTSAGLEFHPLNSSASSRRTVTTTILQSVQFVNLDARTVAGPRRHTCISTLEDRNTSDACYLQRPFRGLRRRRLKRTRSTTMPTIKA